MSYYYIDELNNVVGPLNLEDLHNLHANGTIHDSTSVAHAGDQEWIEFKVFLKNMTAADSNSTSGSYRSPEMSVRDQLFGKANFNENTYRANIDILTIAKLTATYFEHEQFTIQTNSLQSCIEITAKRAHKEDPYIISIASLKPGVRISFIRTRGLHQLLRKSIPLACLSIILPPLGLLGAGAAVAVAGVERKEEKNYWIFIESKINENSPPVVSTQDAPIKPNAMSEIELMWDLHQKGAITKEEFEERKKRLLS